MQFANLHANKNNLQKFQPFFKTSIFWTLETTLSI